MIRYSCPRCRTVLESPDSHGDSRAVCPQCGQPLRVPPPAAQPAARPRPEQSLQSHAPPRPAPLFSPQEPLVGQRAAGETPRPDAWRRTRPAAPSGPPLWAQFVLLGVLFCGGGLSFAGCIAVAMAAGQGIGSYGAEEEPDEVRLSDLLDHWPRCNHHVVLTDFVCGKPFYLEASSEDAGMWVPVYTPEEVSPDPHVTPSRVRALLYFPHEEDDDVVLQQCRRGRLQGLVTSGPGLSYPGVKFVRKQSPDTNFFTCLKVEVGRKPLSRAVLWALVVGGAAAALVGAVVCVAAFCALAPGAVRSALALLLSPFRRSRPGAGTEHGRIRSTPVQGA